jgi:hypothetical protein
MFLDELMIDENAESLEGYWQSGLNSVLEDDWESAQAALMMPFFSCESEQQEQLVRENLLEFLHGSSESQSSEGLPANGYKILSFAHSLFPEDLNTLLRLAESELRTHQFSLSG